MQVFVNDEPREVAPGTTILALLASLGMESAPGIALAINSRVLPRDSWGKAALQDNDRVLLIRATKGG